MHQALPLRGAAAALFAVLPLLDASLRAQGRGLPQPKNYEEAVARHRECLTRLPFMFHTEGRRVLAETKKLEALPILVDDYAKVKEHQEYARYTLAYLFGKHFDRAEAVAPLAALRRANQKPIDTWLWVKSLRIELDRSEQNEAMALALESKNTLHRAAAIAALGESKQGSLKNAIVTTCATFPKKEWERMALLGAMSGALYDNRSRVNEADYREALRAYISLLAEDVKLSHLGKVQMARHLQWILNAPGMFVNPEPWLEILDRGEVKQPKQGQTSAAPRFFGVETDGEHIIYVIDMSDSMCKEIAPSAKPPAAAITGPRQKKPRALLDESDLPWNVIKTRWDLAREQLKISLWRLTPEKHFAVVWFGTDAGTLECTKGMVKATKANIDRAVAELMAIETGKPDPVKAPDGILRGKTNLHAGLRIAFGLTDRGFVESGAYVDPNVLAEGCDTIFLLSDGAPSWDEFNVVDKDYGEGNVVVDTEYGAGANRTPQLHYHGPYDQDEWLVEDVTRMNAFRRIRMHCIGLGEANMRLLEQLGKSGRGEVFLFGQAKQPAGKGGAGAGGGSSGGPSKK